jgi:hypothetical protein
VVPLGQSGEDTAVERHPAAADAGTTRDLADLDGMSKDGLSPQLIPETGQRYTVPSVTVPSVRAREGVALVRGPPAPWPVNRNIPGCAPNGQRTTFLIPASRY